MWIELTKITDIYNATNTLLQSIYAISDYKYYGHEISSGYETPCFFVDIIPKDYLYNYKKFAHRVFTIMITYFQKIPNEIDNLTKADEITELFGYCFPVMDRKIPIVDSNYMFVGDKKNILQVNIEVDCYETIEKSDTCKIASELNLNNEKR